MYGNNYSPSNGYLLFYRSRSLNKENDDGILEPKIIYKNVPKFWEEMIIQENNEFLKKYEEEDKELEKKAYLERCFQLFIYPEKDIEIVDDIAIKVYFY